MVERDETFPARYIVEDADLALEVAIHHDFSTSGVSSLAPTLEIDVTPADGNTWRGSFFGGRDDTTRVIHGPSPDLLIAVAGGVAYSIVVPSPEVYEVLKPRPVRDVLCSKSANIVILVGYTYVLAVGTSGRPEWMSDRLVSDGFTEVRLTDDSIVLGGFDAPSHRDVVTTLSLFSGEIEDRR